MYVPEEFRSRVLLAPQVTATGEGGYVAPTPAANALTIRAVVNMANAADLPLTLQSADDAIGTNAVNFSTVPIYVNGVRQTTDNYTYTVSNDTGNFIVDFCVQPELIPQGKTIGLAFANSNAANLISALIIEDVAYAPTES
jgi:hypothetical protein